MKKIEEINKIFRSWNLKQETSNGKPVLVHEPTGRVLEMKWSSDLVSDLSKPGGVDAVDFWDFMLGSIWEQVRKLEPELEMFGLAPKSK